MKKEVGWLYSPCVMQVLESLAAKPQIPMQIRKATGIPWNYVNVILKRLEQMKIALCLTPHEKIGKVYCINAKKIKIVEKVLMYSDYRITVNPIPELNWKAYGRLSCNICTQLRIVFSRSLILRSRGERITEGNLETELKGKDGVLLIDRSDVYRALKQLNKLGLITRRKNKGFPIEFDIPKDALLLAAFLNPQ